MTVLCTNPTGFTCAGAGYNGTSSQIGGNGWTTAQYWKFGSAGPNGTLHNCTTYAAYRLQRNGYAYPGWTSNANLWAANAQSHGVAVNQTPAVGSIAQWNSGTGHVAYVEAVTATYIITTSDSYQIPKGTAYGTDRLQIARNSAYMPDNFIHFKDAPAVPQALPALPASPKVAATTATSAVLTWKDASKNETGFASQYRIGSGSWKAGPSVGANATKMTVTGLKASTSYTFQVGARNSVGTHWSAYFTGKTAKQPVQPPKPVQAPQPTTPAAYHTGRQVTIDTHATGGVSGHKGAANSYATGPTHPKNTALWIVCYVTGQSITGPYDTTTMWDLSDDGYYYTDAWLYTGTNGAAVPKCALKTVTVDKHATGGVSGHKGPGNTYATGPTHAVNTPVTIACYVAGQSITGPYDTTTMWDLANDGYYYTDAWLYTGTNGAAVPHC
ncbi:MAG: CHAP domain-containing protein [Trebonia sp.]